MAASPRRQVIAAGLGLALAVGLLFFYRLGGHPLLDPDEARHAEVAREMAAAHGLRRLFLPTLELVPYREKPAPYYWLVSLAYGAGGVDEAAARSVSALAALATVIMCFAYTVPRHGLAGALGAGIVLATSAGWFGFARYANLDMTLTAFVVAGVLSGLAWLDGPVPRRRPLAPYVAAGLATLVKGPVGAALVAGPLALAVLLRQPRPRPKELGLARGVCVALAIAALYYVPLGFLDASYLEAFTATNLRRFTAESRHAAPVYYYAAWLPVLFLPWSLFAIPALVAAARDPSRRVLVVWAVLVPAVLSLARGKLASYALSALAPLALVVGPGLARAAAAEVPANTRRAVRGAGWIVAAALVAVALAAATAGVFYPIPPLGRLLLGAAALGWAAALAGVLRRQRTGVVPLVVLGAVLTLYPLLLRFVAPVLGADHSNRGAAQLVARVEGAPVLSFSSLAPSLVFYLRTPLVWTEDTDLVRDLFAAEAPVFLITGKQHYGTIERLVGARAHVWWSNRRRRLYANLPAPGPGSQDAGANGSQ